MSNWTLKEKSVGDLTVKIEGKEWADAVKKAFNKIAKNVSINGFRKGQAPKALIEKRVSDNERFITAVDDNANVWMRAALEAEKLVPISQPQLDIKAVDANGVELVFTFAVMPEVKLGDYKGLEYNLDEVAVSDEEVDAELNRMREQYAEVQTKDGAAAEGDTVNIDYEGFKDDVAFDGGKGTNYDLVLGSHSFIPGFEEKLVGVKAGEEKDLNLTFPENYHAKDLKGAAVVFKVKVNEVKTKVLPEVNDEFAKDVNAAGVETVADLKNMIRTRIEDGKKSQAENKADTALMDKLVENAEIDLPEVLVEEEVNNQIQQLAQQISQYGMNFNQYLSMMGKKIEDVRAEYTDNATKTAKLRLILEEIAKVEALEPTEEDLENEYNNIAAQYNMPVDQVKAYISVDMLKRDVRNEKAYAFVKENAAGGKKPAKKPAKKTTKKADKAEATEEKPVKKTTRKKKSEVEETAK
ncbi:trigger factor [Solobacterium moorei]|uniref:trigger factor n=1 Tax=Solobacterium moorei TaxID=102148 RepID=UPI0023F32BB5|nr:trigger factor [Solobacterium moorei]MDI6413820.1 trigger factor [Solobacterium moorei]